MQHERTCLFIFVISLLFSFSCFADDWSITEVQYKNGELDTPEQYGGGKNNTDIITIQHAAGWK